MREFLFAAALSISSIAIAQTQPESQPPAEDTDAAPATENMQPSGETVDDRSQATGPEGVTQQGTDPQGQATAPAGTNQMPAMGAPSQPMMAQPNQSATFAPRAATGDYPPCSRTVTDGCTQTYERGVRRTRPQ
jgi:hypothetical protein